ncbi:MAG: undecaprenyl-diphosphate phosphatase [Acidobacteria bacterium]|nr:undecaprenyl-diphosphate phosphatase [Acidobacteriota bacterium]MYH22967.1 undecaprenyl-diphosphate phosphatase [Acidobacteriota bacterium]MYK80769.1 undecaprenyl-diphosphate phosphatase [Acidobacteriota bacterium]
MNIGASLLLGIVQGLTEFLPVSSSGHLVLGRALLPDEALRSPGVLFEIVVHLGTLTAALIYLRREVFGLVSALAGTGGTTPEGRDAVRAGRGLVGLLLVASIPAAVVGVAFQDQIHHAFSGIGFAAGGLVLTGAVLLYFRRPPEETNGDATRIRTIPLLPRGLADALWIGIAQAAAIFPGVSRSGLTIVAGRQRGVAPADAARFSFLLSAPAIAGATLLEGASALGSGALAEAGGVVALELTVGFLTAFVAGTFALRWVFDWLARERFHQFGWYCLSVGGIGIGLSSA